MSALPQPGRFHATRPKDLHAPPPPWHRLAFIVAELPARLGALSAQLEIGSGDRLLDYGCADTPYRHLFPADAEYLAADLPGNPLATVTVEEDGTVPIEDASVDGVLSTQVLEHVTDPATYLEEVARVLRPGGRLLLSTHGMMFYHPDPVDYWRWTCAGLRRAAEDAGLEIIHFEGIMGMAATGVQMVQEAFYYRLPLRLRNAFALVMQSLAKLFDRVEPQAGRDLNAMVFVLVARKP